MTKGDRVIWVKGVESRVMPGDPDEGKYGDAALGALIAEAILYEADAPVPLATARDRARGRAAAEVRG